MENLLLARNDEALLYNTFQRIFFSEKELLNKAERVIYFVEIIVRYMIQISAQF